MYCAIGGCDVADKHPEVVKTADDYLWLKLCQVRGYGDEELGDITAVHSDRLTYSLLQSLISEEYGLYSDITKNILIFLANFSLDAADNRQAAAEGPTFWGIFFSPFSCGQLFVFKGKNFLVG